MAGLPSDRPTTSFWHSEPSKILLGHRTTEELPPYADAVIVGSGITGASVARFLAEDERARDLSVVMLEAREACWGATGRNGGHCQPLLFDSTPDVAAFEVLNYNTVKSHITQHSIPCEWRSLPGCRTFWTQPLADAARHEVQHLQQAAPHLGKDVTFISNPDELRKLRVNDAPAATLTVDAGSLWPYKYIAFILEKLIKDQKLNIQTHTPVTSISPASSSETSSNAKARHILHTSRGSISANHIILATNAYTSHLLPEFTSLIVPERGVMSALLPPKGMPRLSTSFGFVGANGSNPLHDDYLNQRPSLSTSKPSQPKPEIGAEEAKEEEGGHLMFGGGSVAATLPALGQTDDSILDPGPAAYLRHALLQLLTLGGETEKLEGLEATQQWSGIWGDSRDHHPWVGAVPDREGIWLSGGYSGHGMPNASLCGKAVVEMVLGEESGAPKDFVEERLVRKGELPKAYVISRERMERAREMETVEEQNRKGMEMRGGDGRWEGGEGRLV